MIIPEADRLNSVQEYYFSSKLQEIGKMNSEGRDVINLGIGSPDLAPSDETINALVESAKKQQNHGYQNYKGVQELRIAMANWYAQIYDVSLDPDKEILPLMGSKEGIMHISSAFLNAGDIVLVPNPGYPTYTSVSKLMGATISYYDLDENDDWNIDIQKLKEQDLSRVKIMWINYPHMPTGALGRPKMFEELIALALKYEFLICNDNPYSMILNEVPSSMLQYAGAREVVIELNSLSKSHNMAGWRMGWVSGNASYISAILKVKSNMDSGMFLPIQHAAIQAFGNNAQWHDAQNKIYRIRREKSWAMMDLLGASYSGNQTGLFVWAKVDDSVKDVETYIDEILYGANVFITPGFIFGSNGSRYIRMSLCTKQEVIEEAIDRVSNYLNKH